MRAEVSLPSSVVYHSMHSSVALAVASVGAATYAVVIVEGYTAQTCEYI